MVCDISVVYKRNRREPTKEPYHQRTMSLLTLNDFVPPFI